jgi:hypothetical protein
MKSILGGFLVVAGMMAIAGSANDCDGKCMEFANSLEEMLVIIGIGLTMMVTGGIILYNDNHGE